MRSGSRLARNFILGGWQLFAGLFGNAETKLHLKGKVLKTLLEIICHAYALMVYWSGLFAELDRD